MGEDGARTRVRMARNSSRTSGERGLIGDERGQNMDGLWMHGCTDRDGKRCGQTGEGEWVVVAELETGILDSGSLDHWKTHLDDFVTEDCIVSNGDGPRRAGEGAVAAAVAARVISWACWRCSVALHTFITQPAAASTCASALTPLVVIREPHARKRRRPRRLCGG